MPLSTFDQKMCLYKKLKNIVQFSAPLFSYFQLLSAIIIHKVLGNISCFQCFADSNTLSKYNIHGINATQASAPESLRNVGLQIVLTASSK